MRWRFSFLFIILGILALAGSLVVRAPLIPAGPAAPAPWPTAGWQTAAPEEQGIDSTKLADALLSIHREVPNIHSLLLVRNGYLVLDAAFYPYDGKTPHE